MLAFLEQHHLFTRLNSNLFDKSQQQNVNIDLPLVWLLAHFIFKLVYTAICDPPMLY